MTNLSLHHMTRSFLRQLVLAASLSFLMGLMGAPVQAQHPFPVKPGYVLATCSSRLTNDDLLGIGAGFRSGYVFGIIDARDPSGISPNENWDPHPTMYHGLAPEEWTSDRMGQVFGIASDRQGNIYLSATAMYVTGLLQGTWTQTLYRYSGIRDFGTAGSGGVYRISNTTAGGGYGAVTDYLTTASEAAISRIYGGIHVRSAIERGLVQGQKIGSRMVSLALKVR